MATTTMGQPITTTERQNITRGIYWAIAVAIIILLGFTFVASQNKPQTMPVETNTLSVPQNTTPAGVGLVPDTAPVMSSPTEMNSMEALPPNSETVNPNANPKKTPQQ